MDRPTRRTRARLLGLAVIPASLVVTCLFVTTSSYSVFSATTTNSGDSWSAGTLTLTNDSAAAMFAVPSMKPGGAAVTKCITVTSNGTTPSSVKLYSANASTTNSLSTYLSLQVEIGSATSASGGACTGFAPSSTIVATSPLASFTSSRTSFTNGAPTAWSPTGGGSESKAFRFTVTPLSTMGNAQMGSTAQTDFVWEAQS